MQYNELANTGVQVSRICLGTMTWGQQNTEAEAHEQMDYALSQGVNFFDTAELYPVPPQAPTQGLTETYMGNWFAARNNRDKVILATKAAGPGEWVNYIRGGPRFNKAHLQQALDDSLKRLQTDYIDLYQLHWPDRQTNFFGQLGYQHQEEEQSTPILETLEALHELVQAGKIRYIGLSNETPWGFMSFLNMARQQNYPQVVSVQNPYNLLNRSYEVGMAEISVRENAGLLAYSPLGFGVLSGKYLNGQQPPGARLTEFTRFTRYTSEIANEATQAYADIAAKHGLSFAQMALAFVNSRRFLTANIVGATDRDQLAENIASIDLQLTEEQLADIEAVHQRNTNPCP